jgi:hypothetical protein
MDEYDTSIAKAPAVRETAGEFLLIIKKIISNLEKNEFILKCYLIINSQT